MIEKITQQKKHFLSATKESKLIQSYRSYAFDCYAKNFKENETVDIEIDTLQNIAVPFQVLPSGVVICSINDFVLRYSKIAQHYFSLNENFSWEKTALGALIESSWAVGIVVYVPPKTIDKNILAVHTLFESSPIEKILIIIDDGAQIRIKDTRISQQKTSLRATDVFVGKNAQLNFDYLQNHAQTVIDGARYSFYGAQQSNIEINVILHGAQKSTTWFDLSLNGIHAQASLKGAYVLNSTQQLKLITNQTHAKEKTESNLAIRGLVTDHAHVYFNGLITIDKEAHQTNAAQENKNIALSDDARVYSEPSLQVLTNDVQCAHGSAIGQLDKEQLLYMQSRGIEEQQATHLLLKSFLAPVVKSERIDELIKKVG